MTHRLDDMLPPLRRADDVARSRNCLRCTKPFDSEWSGERICRGCKSKQTWATGTPPVFGYSRRR